MDNKKISRASVNLGSVFPRDCEKIQENLGLESCYPIYLKLCDLYRKEKIDLDDFTSLRRALASIPIHEFSSYADFIFSLLSLDDREEILNQVRNYDIKYQCHLFEKREKIVERDPSSNQIVRQVFGYVTRPAEFGDVFRIAKAMVSKMSAYPREFIDSNFVIASSKDDELLVAKKNYEACEVLLSCRELIEEIMNKIYEWFDTTFQEFRLDPRFQGFFESRREILESTVISYIYTKKEASFRLMEHEKNTSHNDHVFEVSLRFFKHNRNSSKKMNWNCD